MAYFQLTEAMILTSFEETGIDEKYYPIYAKIAKRFFEDLSKEGSNEEEQTEEDNYAISSLNLADEYITYYAKEAEKGHCEQWCDTIADKGEDDYWAYHDAYDFIENEEEKEKELSIHAKSLSDDPVFVERYIYLFKEQVENSYEMAKEYSKAFHKCIMAKAKTTHMVMLMLSVRIIIWMNIARCLLKHMIWLKNMTKAMVRLYLLENYVLTF